MNMPDQMIEFIRKYYNDCGNRDEIFTEIEIPARTTLLTEGEIADRIYFVKKGCLRMWFNKDGRDVTFQFFFEGQPVASIDSFLNGQPGMFSIESIEPSVLLAIKKETFEEMHRLNPELKEMFNSFIFKRFSNYAQLFLSRIRDTPAERYDELIKNHPEIIKRVPQHYIASYLGITPVSLSRIRNRK
jgi:CRP-like cAMP-binding protein